MAYLTKANLKGYKSIRNTDITFCEGLNIVIGQNGSGKTNFFEFLEDVLQTAVRQKYNTNYDSKIVGQLDKGKTVDAEIIWVYTYILRLSSLQLFSADKKEPPKNEVKVDFYCTDNRFQPFLTSFTSQFLYLKYGITTSLTGLENDFDWVLNPNYKIDSKGSIYVCSILKQFFYLNKKHVIII